MKIKYFKTIVFFLLTTSSFAQTGHVLQGVGAVNMSMGGASTAQPTDINGALLWNPAAISAFKSNELSFNAGVIFASPELSSSVSNLAAGILQGSTKSDQSPIFSPSIAMIHAKEGSNHTFGFSIFGVSGLGAIFPLEKNNPLMGENFDPTKNSNPINYPQQAGGLGQIESTYKLLQVGFSYAYKISEKFSIGFQPDLNYQILKLSPNPLAPPDPQKGYPESDNAGSVGFGGQVGIFYDSRSGLKFGASYKTNQVFSELKMKNQYLDGSDAPVNRTNLDYPSIVSVGLGYSKNDFDIALDYRNIFYTNTTGFSDAGWTTVGTVKGFGWKNVSVVCVGLQYKGIDKMSFRAGYTYSTSPIDKKLAFFSVAAPANIKHAVQAGAGYGVSKNLDINVGVHYGTSGGTTTGKLMSPLAATPTNPYGELEDTQVSFKATILMVNAGVNYRFGNSGKNLK